MAPPPPPTPPLPNPPDPNAPGSNVNGPLKGASGSYTGGVLTKKEPDMTLSAPTDEFVAEFDCTAGEKTLTKTIPVTVGLSLQGPVSNDQTQGIIDAMKDARSGQKSVTLSTTVHGDPDKKIVWTLTAVQYTRSTTDVYVIVTAVPASEKLVGYITTDTPKALIVNSTETPCASAPPLVEIGAGFNVSKGWLDGLFDWFNGLLPDDGIPGFIDYGRVYIFSGGSLYGGTDVRSGETVSFVVPPGTYTISADVGIFGIHFSVPSQTVSPPQGENIIAMIIYVTLSVIEIVWIIIIIIVVVILAILYLVLRHFLWGGGGEQPQETPPPSGTEGQTPPPKAQEPEQEADQGEQS